MSSSYIPDYPGDVVSTVVYNSGEETLVVSVDYQDYKATFELPPKGSVFFPVVIPKEAFTLLGGHSESLKVVWPNVTFTEIPVIHTTLGGYLSRKGRFKIPGVRGDYWPWPKIKSEE